MSLAPRHGSLLRLRCPLGHGGREAGLYSVFEFRGCRNAITVFCNGSRISHTLLFIFYSLILFYAYLSTSFCHLESKLIRVNDSLALFPSVFPQIDSILLLRRPRQEGPWVSRLSPWEVGLKAWLNLNILARKLK